LGLFNRKETKEQKARAKKMTGSLRDYPDLLAIKPVERYVFHSDYFQIDDSFATIMSFFHQDGANDGYGPFWGVNKIPSGLGDDVSILLVEQTRRMTEGWLLEHQNKAEGVAKMNENEQQRAGSNTTKGKASRRSEDLYEVAQEL
jgi:hypothetical protein